MLMTYSVITCLLPFQRYPTRSLTNSHRSPASTPGPSHGPTEQLDPTTLALSVQWYFKQGLGQTTQRAYSAASKRFHELCNKFNLTTPFPTTQLTLSSFAAYLANDGLSPSTIKTYLLAVRNLQISLGFPDPSEQSSLPTLKYILAGISHLCLQAGASARPDLPLWQYYWPRSIQR